MEALRAKIPATALYMARQIEVDDRVKEVLRLATNREIPVLEVMRPELDRLAGHDSVHQGLALKVPPYQYAHPLELLDTVLSTDETPLLVALDGITDPRNLGAICLLEGWCCSSLCSHAAAVKKKNINKPSPTSLLNASEVRSTV